IFEKCTEVVEAARVLGERVLVHCHAGVSRSSTIVLAYLMRWRGLTLYESWLLTYKARPIIRPNEGFARALQELEREMHPHLANSTLPLFWMCDSYANFLEFLEVRERACRAGAQWPAPSNTLLDPPRGMMVTVPGLPLGRANSEDLGGDSDAWRAGMQVRAGLVRAGPVAVEEKAAAYAEKVHIVRGRSRGLSFGGRAG
ncbi:protein-tyrosine phosphatase-like protein, partial [Chytriomyces sp. MP71]